MSFKGVVYIDRDNKLTMKVQQADPGTGILTDVDMTDATKMVLHVVSYDKLANNKPNAIVATADTSADPTLIDFSVIGELTLTIGALTITGGNPVPAGEYYMRVTKYVGAVKTQIIHERTQAARLEFVNVDTI